MNPEAVLEEFRSAGALLQGHFILSSGRRSPTFLQKMTIFSDPARTERLCKALAETITARFGKIDIVVSPAIGGIVPGYETARHLGAKAIFVERDPGGPFELRRGFSIPQGTRAVIVEDIVTTGLSARECLASLKGQGGEIVGAACLIDRSGGRGEIGLPLLSLVTLDIPDYAPDAIPPELAAIPPVKPGSRAIPAK